MSLTVTVLGSSGSYPGKGRACSGYLVQGGGTTVWLDAGSGTMANLQKHIRLDEVDAVVISHEHPDHWADLNGFQVACAYGDGPDTVAVYAPSTLCEFMYRFNRPSLEWNVISDGSSARIGGQSWRFSKTDHPPETLAARVDVDGSSLGYTADTGDRWSPSALGAGLDLLMAEATFQDMDAAEIAKEGSEVGHLSARQAGELARAAGIPRLVITHIWPTHDLDLSRRQAEEGFGGSVEVANEGDKFVVGDGRG
ncbi:MAG TPA: MBL fold metallo-hydrolase [Acidimicrobiales bacterium]|nr:MBL fold metallo-hydrolase [Acidimicrobiales bacterium]